MMRFELPDFVALICHGADLEHLAVEKQPELKTSRSETYHVSHLHWPASYGIRYSVELFPLTEQARITIADPTHKCFNKTVYMLCGNRNSINELMRDVIDFAEYAAPKK